MFHYKSSDCCPFKDKGVLQLNVILIWDAVLKYGKIGKIQRQVLKPRRERCLGRGGRKEDLGDVGNVGGIKGIWDARVTK